MGNTSDRHTHAKMICSETTGGGEDGFKHPTINSSSASMQEGTERTGANRCGGGGWRKCQRKEGWRGTDRKTQ